MTNNKQSMKLYTEEQVKHAIKMARSSHNIFTTPFMYDKDEIIEHFTPIELPSDSLCINCDESKSTHNVCMDCMIKIGKENIELPSDEDIREWAEMQSLGEPTGAEEFGRIYGAKWMRDKIQGGNK